MKILILLLFSSVCYGQTVTDSTVIRVNIPATDSTPASVKWIRFATTYESAIGNPSDSLVTFNSERKRALVSPLSLPISAATQTALNLKANTSAFLGYALHVQALTSSPADAQTIYFGQLPKAPVTTANVSKVYIRKAGTITAANIYCYSGTAGTNEAWPISIRLNNTTDTQIASVASATNERVWSNTGLSIAVAVGDYIEIKAVNPTWVTNPLTTIFGGYIYIQ